MPDPQDIFCCEQLTGEEEVAMTETLQCAAPLPPAHLHASQGGLIMLKIDIVVLDSTDA